MIAMNEVKEFLRAASLLLLMVLGTGLVLMACGSKSLADNRTADSDSYGLNVESMTGTDSCQMELQEGEVLAVHFETVRGSMELVNNLCQIVFAIAVGFLLVTIFYRGGSLLPCILVHSAINTLGTFASDAGLTMEMRLLHLGALIAITVAYTLILTRTLPEKAKKMNTVTTLFWQTALTTPWTLARAKRASLH